MAETGNREQEREALRAQANREELVELITRAMPEDGRFEVMKGLILLRRSAPVQPVYGVIRPALCVIAQGAKEVHLGDCVYRYDPFHYLLVTADLPFRGEVLEATEEEPYLALTIPLDPVLVSSVIVESGHVAPRSQADVKALDVSPLGDDLLDSVVRLVRLLDSPAEVPVLQPLIMKEIIYRLLAGAQGTRLRQIAVLGGQTHRIARAVERLHKEFDRPLRIEEIAGELGMSISGFHHNFKIVTGMSPLQFQKQLRLQEARRLMLGDELDAATAGYRVGYDNASQFSREYKRLFGEPPMRYIERVREATRESAL